MSELEPGGPAADEAVVPAADALPPPSPKEAATPAPVNRRRFLHQVGGVTVAGMALGALGTVGAAGVSLFPARRARAEEIGPTMGEIRAAEAFNLRVAAAKQQRNFHLPSHPCNDDDVRYPGGRISYTKALPHDYCGIGNPDAYKYLREALKSGNPDDFENIPLGGVVKLVDPQAALAFDLEGADSHHLFLPPAPAYQSAETAAEMVELYWQALTRDVRFDDYAVDEYAQRAAEELTNLPAFTGPRDANGYVTAQTLFRGSFPGDLDGPYVSQFLLWDVPYGAEPFAQRLRTVVPGEDYLTRFDEWLNVQNGAPAGSNTFDPVRRYIRNARDIGEYVHRDFPAQAYLNAALILLNLGARTDEPSRVFDSGLLDDRLASILDQGNPYLRSRTQAGFTQFGGPDILAMVADVTNHALRAAWYQKWSVHRRLRPEEFGGRIQVLRDRRRRFPPCCVVPVDDSVLNSEALRRTYERWNSYLLPQAFPEGSPTHPAYPSGHAVYSGACVTVLKAFFNEDAWLTDSPQVASRDGVNLVDSPQPVRLTVGGELNKLASNIALARNAAGVHWRSDATQGILLGEQVGIRYLQDLVRTYNQSYRRHPSFPGYHLTRFNSCRIRINPDGTITYLTPCKEDDLA